MSKFIRKPISKVIHMLSLPQHIPLSDKHINFPQECIIAINLHMRYNKEDLDGFGFHQLADTIRRNIRH